MLATPGTVARDYTRALVRDFAGDCEVELVGSARLADLAERRLRGEPFDVAEIGDEIAPCFVERDGRRTDKIVLACTHFPLLTDLFAAAAPWPVDFIDPGAGDRAPGRCAARATARTGARPGAAPAIFTSGARRTPELRKALLRLGLAASAGAGA